MLWWNDRRPGRSRSETPVPIRAVISRAIPRRYGYLAAVLGALIALVVRLALSPAFGDRTFFTLYVIPTLYLLLRRWAPLRMIEEESAAA